MVCVVQMYSSSVIWWFAMNYTFAHHGRAQARCARGLSLILFYRAPASCSSRLDQEFLGHLITPCVAGSVTVLHGTTPLEPRADPMCFGFQDFVTEEALAHLTGIQSLSNLQVARLSVTAAPHPLFPLALPQVGRRSQFRAQEAAMQGLSKS